MELGINIRSIKRLNKQFWLLVFIFVLPATAFSATVNFATMLGALKNNAGPIITFTVAVAYVIGIWFMISAIMELKKIGESAGGAHGTLGGPLLKFIVGVLLVYLPSTIDISAGTLWGASGVQSALSYSPAGGDMFAPAKQGALAIIQVVGYISFVRGLIMLSHSSDQGSQAGSFGKGLMHIIGGILAINIIATIRIIGNSLGFSTI